MYIPRELSADLKCSQNNCRIPMCTQHQKLCCWLAYTRSVCSVGSVLMTHRFHCMSESASSLACLQSNARLAAQLQVNTHQDSCTDLKYHTTLTCKCWHRICAIRLSGQMLLTATSDLRTNPHCQGLDAAVRRHGQPGTVSCSQLPHIDDPPILCLVRECVNR